MLTIVACILSGVVVLGFYGYVFAHLLGEHRKMKRLEKHLADHMSRVSPRQQPKAKTGAETQSRRFPGAFRSEALVNVAVTAAGLAAMFAELEILNQLLSASH